MAVQYASDKVKSMSCHVSMAGNFFSQSRLEIFGTPSAIAKSLNTPTYGCLISKTSCTFFAFGI